MWILTKILIARSVEVLERLEEHKIAVSDN